MVLATNSRWGEEACRALPQAGERMPMTVAAKCKFCQKPLSLEVDEEFMLLGNPDPPKPGRRRVALPVEFSLEKLLAVACCNRCGDHKVANRELAKKIKRVCLAFDAVRNPSKASKDRFQGIIEALTKQYVRLVGDYLGLPDLAWEADMADMIVDSPDNYGHVLRAIWKTGREARRLL